jgi:hypothetical protein
MLKEYFSIDAKTRKESSCAKTNDGTRLAVRKKKYEENTFI